jgi:hypothetical protein
MAERSMLSREGQMKELVLYALMIASLLAFTSSGEAAPIAIGAPANDLNCAPFGCQLATGSRYQQVYSSAAFPGPILINEIQFYQTISGDLNIGSFEFYLSTTSVPVNGLGNLLLDSIIPGGATHPGPDGLPPAFMTTHFSMRALPAFSVALTISGQGLRTWGL